MVWTLIGLLVAVGLDRPVAVLARLLRGRRPLTLAVVGLLVAGVVMIAAVLLAGRGDVAGSLPDEPTDMAQAFADLPLIGGPLERAGTAEAPATALADLPDKLKLAGSAAPARLVEVVMGSAAGLFWVTVIVGSALLDGPRLLGAARRTTPARYRRQFMRLIGAVQVAVARYVAGSAFVAAMNGVVLTSLALLLGAPLTIPIGLWAFGWNFVPQIGGFVGGVPFLVLAFGQGSGRGIVALIAFVI